MAKNTNERHSRTAFTYFRAHARGNICYDHLAPYFDGLGLFSPIVDALTLSGSILAAAVPEGTGGNPGRGRARLFQTRRTL